MLPKNIPRDAYEQWMVSERISAKDLKAGDLIFVSAKDLFETIVHVMLYIGGENFIESPASGDIVRIRTFKDKFGMTLSELKEKDFIANGKKLYFGRVVITEDR